MIWYRGRYWRYDGWITRRDPYFGWIKQQRRGRFPGYVQITDESTGEVRRLRSDKVIVNAVPD